MKNDGDESDRRKDILLEASHRSLICASSELNKLGLELTNLKLFFKALMNSLGQGFVVFDKAGICGTLYSEASVELLEGNPAGRHILDVLQIEEEKREGFVGWIELLFSGSMDFADLADLGPKTFPSILGKQIDLAFRPILGEEGEIVAVVVIATDNTAEQNAKEEARRKQNYADMIVKITKDRNPFRMFVKQVRSMIAMLAECAAGKKELDLVTIQRLLHTIKGGAASFYIQSIKKLAHTFESEIIEIAAIHKGKDEKDPEFLKEILPKIENYGVSLELELANFLTEHYAILGENLESQGYEKSINLDTLLSFSEELEKIKGSEAVLLRFLKELVSVSLKESLMQFDSVVQSTASKVNKKMKPLEYSGEDVRILHHIYENLMASTIHIFTNAVIHGIEEPSEREAAGKSQLGTIVISVSLEKADPDKEWMIIVVKDDGKGINPEAIRKNLKKSGRDAEADTESDEQVIQHIFDAGVSTKETVTDMAGRGIGLNAVKDEAERLGGSVWVSTSLGKGTQFQIRLPYIWKAVARLKAA